MSHAVKVRSSQGSQSPEGSIRLSLSSHAEFEPHLPRAHARLDPLPVSRWSAAPLGDRVRALCAGKTPQTIARMTGATADSVRRYLRGAAVPPSFLVALATELDVSLNWVLSGRGPIRRAEVVTMALDRSNTSDLLGELARRLSAVAMTGEPAATVGKLA